MSAGMKEAGLELNKGVVFSLLFLVVVGFCVSKVKYEVVFLKNKLRTITAQIEKYKDDLKVYNAEWGHLNDPKRLARLAAKYLPDLQPTENRQMITLDMLLSDDVVKIRPDIRKETGENIQSDKRVNEHTTERKRNLNRAFGSFLDGALRENT